MNKYSQKAERQIEKTVHEFKKGKLKSGRSGKKSYQPKTGRGYWDLQSAQSRP